MQIFATLQFYLCLYVLYICQYVAPPGECYYNSLLCCEEYFSSSSVILRAFSALYVYSKFGHHPHPLGYLCAKFRFFRGLHCWASPRRKSAYSVTHSPSLFDVSVPQCGTRSSAIAEEPRDALRQLKSCKMLHKCSTDCMWKRLQPVNDLQGHSRSLLLPPFDRPYTISY